MDASWIEKIMLAGIAGKLFIVLQFELFKQAGAVRAYRFGAQPQICGDILDPLAFCDHAKDLVFPVRDGFVRQVIIRTAYIIGHELCHSGAEIICRYLQPGLIRIKIFTKALTIAPNGFFRTRKIKKEVTGPHPFLPKKPKCG